MKVDLPRAVRVLRREYLFQGLETDQLARVASFFEQVEMGQGQQIFAEGQKPDYFYIILDGKVRITRRAKGKRRLVNILGPGDFFGEMALLFHFPRNASASAMTPLLLLRLGQDGFQVLLKEYPRIRLNLSATAKSRALARHLHFNWLAPDEVIYYLTRKHTFFLVMRLIGPAFLLGLSIVIGGWILRGGEFPGFLAFVPSILLFVVGLGWGAWGWLDWSNDYYIVTSQRVVWYEIILALYDSRREAPLDAVMAINVTTSWLGRALNYGNVDVRTFTGSILMRRMDKPHLFASFVEGYKKRVMEMSKLQEVKRMGEDLQDALRMSQMPPEDIEVPIASGPPSLVTKKVVKKKTGSAEWWRTFLKVRYVEGDVITYRKHWFLLLAKTILPLLMSIAILGLDIYLGSRSLWVPVLLSVPLWIGSIIWLVYHYVDWRNDIYRLTPEQILDIEKKPLGREVKKTASLESPDFRVEHTRATLLHILLNFGNVIISIGQTQFDFIGVFNPDQVHQDVADYREAFMRRKREAAAKSERDRMIQWLVSFHEQAEKLEKTENNPEA